MYQLDKMKFWTCLFSMTWMVFKHHNKNRKHNKKVDTKIAQKAAKHFIEQHRVLKVGS